MKKKTLLARLCTLLLCTLAFAPVGRAQVKDTLTFAVMGNSISTYYDYLPQGYAIYYSQSRENQYGIQVGDTWWMQLSRQAGMTFLVNSSWSGSRVACTASGGISQFTSNDRIASVGRYGTPDFIFIAGGTNDWNHGGIPLGEFSTETFTDSTTFRGAYAMLLNKLQRKYPQMKIVCLGIFPRGDSATKRNAAGWSQTDGNASIKQIAEQFGAYYVDCADIPFSTAWGTYTLDRLHPTTAGHKLIADCITNSLRRQGILSSSVKPNNEVSSASCLINLSFDADGIVNRGTQECTIGKRGKATTLYDAANDTYYGCTRAVNSDYFYATYDEASPLAKAFNQSVTWETLVRLEGLANGTGSCEKACFWSSEQDGGWSFYNSRYASTFSYTHTSGLKSQVKDLTEDRIMLPGRFYHLVVTMDRASHTIRYFVNGQLVCTGTRCGTDMQMPKIGSQAGKRGMWICLGGDPISGTYTTAPENGAACTFVFARIYDGALTQRAAEALYTDQVKRFTEPADVQRDLLLDLGFTANGPQNMAAPLPNTPIEVVGDLQTSYNADLQTYEATFTGDRHTFLKYNLGTNPAAMNAMSNAYSMEVYCRTDAKPTATVRPVAFNNGYGVGVQMNTAGNIAYATTTQGYKEDGTDAKTQWTSVGNGTLTDAYTHYVVVYDRRGGLSALYINGTLAASRTLTAAECPTFEWTPNEWLAIGGDASGTYNATTTLGSYPFRGQIARVRLWGRALDATAVQHIYNQIHNGTQTYTFGSSGYLPICVPFATILPEGVTAHKLVDVSTSTAVIEPVAQAGDLLPYGAAVILTGERQREVTLVRADADDDFDIDIDVDSDRPHKADMSGNLLVGIYADKPVDAGDGYYPSAANRYLTHITAPMTLPAGSCYLPSNQTRSRFVFQVQESAIESPSATGVHGNGALYDLHGRQLSTPRPHSLYIRGSKKILSK